MGLEGVVSKRLDAPYRSGLPKTWLKSKKPRSVKPCDVGAGYGQISVCAVLPRTHFFDAIETVLQRGNGDHEVAAACIQIIRIRAWTVLGGADLGNAPSPDWAGEIDQVLMQGNLITTEVVFFHVDSATVLFTDLIQQFPVSLFSSWRGLVAKLDLLTGPEPSVPRKFRIAFTNRRAARDSLQRIFAWPAERVLMAHGTPVEKDAQAFLRRAFGWLAA
jgi:hypothetical protein